ncbi:hypothetical protein [Endozoicomonas sp. 4G]|uniref:hypothetical protein n=1 Tax=Endozoicomonas sp. 4G TaxID=2872754 RepID=UPI0020789451|nr:hypothetical protein [Endozoicomonas sp. 4G]
MNLGRSAQSQGLQGINSAAGLENQRNPGQSGGRAEKGHVGGMAQAMPPSMSEGR